MLFRSRGKSGVVRGADSELMPVIANLLSKYEIQSVVITIGPGAFTGLRVGVSMALGIAFSKKIPIIPLSSLFARSLLLNHTDVLVLLDARKGRIYGQVLILWVKSQKQYLKRWMWN